MNIENAVVLVTGANRGLGRALVQAALSAGARKVYAAARDPRQVESNERVVPIALDITNARSLKAAAEKATDVTVLFNNAGVLASGSVLASTNEAIAQEFTTNLFGLLGATRAFLPALERAGGAAIVNVLSVASLGNVPGIGAYSASKAAAFSITQALRKELEGKAIAVHGVFAGPIDTDMVKAMPMDKTSPADVARAIVEGVQRGEEDIAPDPVARTVLDMWRRDPKAVERQMASM
jgi:NAD(P)-dependent dehydrogenase (short-subunit alcohol dehydrogenase family)